MKGNTLISPRLIYFYTLAALVLPNIALCLTEGMPMAACVANVLMPLPVYIWLLSLSAKTGKTVWCLFPLIFLAAFQLVLLYLFGQGIISVDMFLNVVTSNPGEMAELLDRLLPNAGIGYRWEFKKDVNVRLDYGFGKGGQSGFIFNINEAF